MDNIYYRHVHKHICLVAIVQTSTLVIQRKSLKLKLHSTVRQIWNRSFKLISVSFLQMRKASLRIRFGVLCFSMFPALHLWSGADERLHTHLALPWTTIIEKPLAVDIAIDFTQQLILAKLKERKPNVSSSLIQFHVPANYFHIKYQSQLKIIISSI